MQPSSIHSFVPFLSDECADALAGILEVAKCRSVCHEVPFCPFFPAVLYLVSSSTINVTPSLPNAHYAAIVTLTYAPQLIIVSPYPYAPLYSVDSTDRSPFVPPDRSIPRLPDIPEIPILSSDLPFRLPMLTFLFRTRFPRTYSPPPDSPPY
jgi:hypothetical protein